MDPEDDVKKPEENNDVGFNYFIPCVYHGLSNYDSKMLIRYFNRRVTRKFDPKTGKHSYQNVHIIAQNLEKIISMDFC